MKRLKKILLSALIIFGLVQFIRPNIEMETEKKKLLADVPDTAENIIRKSCYDCHSNQSDLRWFDKITPANFLVSSHIEEGRSVLNFSQYNSLSSDKRSAELYYALNKAMLGEMPLPSYTMIHRSARLSAADIETMKNYLQSISPRKPVNDSIIHANNQKYTIAQHAGEAKNVKPSPNGIHYISNYRKWKAISSSDRFDNGTMRIIYGNDIAVKAIQDNKTKDWPDGTIFAKAAWWQQTDADGNISTGSFKQVEFMIKDSKKYAATNGWGWARWLNDELKPYGKNETFVQECISCHKPVKDNDYVFTSPLYLQDFLSAKK